MMDKRIGKKATHDTATEWPELTLNGQPFRPDNIQKNWAQANVGSDGFVVIDFGLSPDAIENLMATLRPAKGSKGKAQDTSEDE